MNVSTFDTGYDGGSSGSDSEGPSETLGEKAPFTLRTPPGPVPPQPSHSGLPGPSLPDFWLIVRILQDRVEVYAHARYVEAMGAPGALSLLYIFTQYLSPGLVKVPKINPSTGKTELGRAL